MGSEAQIGAADGHTSGAFRSGPAGSPRGTSIVLQEIFGVNAHICKIRDAYAVDAYVALTPTVYDRSSVRDCSLGYRAADVTVGRQLCEVTLTRFARPTRK